MSCHVRATYEVVSQAELRRRAVAEASDRVTRLLTAFDEIAVALAAAEATYGSLGVTVNRAVPTLGAEPDELKAIAERIEGELGDARSRVNEAIVAVRSEHLSALAQSVLGSLRPADVLAPLSPVTNAQGVTRGIGSHLATARDIASRLPASASLERAARCDHLLAEVASAETELRRETLLAALREEVQQARDAQLLVERNRAEVERLYSRLDGLRGADIEATRGLLRGSRLEFPLPAGLDEQVEGVRAEAIRAADRAVALEVTREVLIQNGFQVGEDFVVDAATEGGAIIAAIGSSGHGIRVREQTGQLVFNVVRFDESGKLELAQDLGVVESFRATFNRIVPEFVFRGLGLWRHLEPDVGLSHLEVRTGPIPFDTTEADRSESRDEDSERELRSRRHL